MRKKRRTYGKTAKQWDALYNRYKAQLKYERGLVKLNKSEFEKAWATRSEGTTIKDIVAQTRKDSLDPFKKYQILYKREERKGYKLSKILSEETFKEQVAEYGSVESVLQAHFEVSKRQVENWLEHLDILRKKHEKELEESGITKMTAADFYKDNDKAAAFWALIDSLGGWEEAFEYND